MEVFINPVYLGDSGESGVFRLNLAESGLSSIRSITVEDDNIISGGTGAASGFDLDSIKISTSLISDPSQVALLPELSAFTFSDSNVLFQPGFLQLWQLGDPAVWNSSQLSGTNGSRVNFSTATLGSLDGSNGSGFGSVSIGEGGRISFNLNSPIAPNGLYLYIADVGGGNDSFRLRVSSEVASAPRSGLALVGTPGDDVIDLVQGTNAPLGFGNDTINGGGGNDTIFSSAGNDVISGDDGNDFLNGGIGNDLCQGFAGDDILNGGISKDTLVGGLGADRFVFDIGRRFQKQSMGVDVITDFTRGQDKIILDRSTFKQLNRNRLRQSDFAKVKNLRQAKESDALITYVRKSGSLFYNENADATGFGRGGKFADLSNGLNLGVSDFTIVF